MILVLCALVGVLIGSVPVAYLVVKRRHGLDVHAEGSGNVGANNAYRTSGSRRTGLAVMVLDALKGMTAVAAGWATPSLLLNVFGGTPDALLQTIWTDGLGDQHLAFWAGSLALLGAIAGHNYNPWLSLKTGRLAGGKGLATAAGGFLLLMPLLVPVWGALFLLGRWAFGAWRGVRDTIPGNVAATALVPLAAWALYGAAALAVLVGLALLVLPKHVGQMRALLLRAE